MINSFREYAYTQAHGYLSFGGWTFDNYQQAWEQGKFGLHFKNSLIITIPAVLLTLFLASTVAFVLARFSFRFNLVLLGVLPRRQPAAAPGAADPRVPDVPGGPAAAVHERQRARCSTASGR